jgi:hypothetical protein
MKAPRYNRPRRPDLMRGFSKDPEERLMNFISGWALQMGLEGHADRARAWCMENKPEQFKRAVEYLAVPFTDAIFSVLASYHRHVLAVGPAQEA